jgi:2-polyprenyl-3-methyl-5-hydroxy-6-metoxy-1,4-benzoquinol methylase
MNLFTKCKICSANVFKMNFTHNLVECEKCKLIFCNQIFSQDDFVKVYDDLYNKNKTHYEYHAQVEFNKLITNQKISIGINREKLIRKHIIHSKVQSVLEFGSGVGLIGMYIKKTKKSIKYSGIELDKISFEKSQKLGLNTYNGDFSIANSIEEKFDIIMLWEVIEHLQDLNLFLKIAHEKLNIGGKILLSTPNYNKIYNYKNRKTDQIFQDAPPIHLNFFTKTNMKNIFEINNFKKVKVNTKKTPYLNLKSFSFYFDLIKSFFGMYHGTTLYLVAEK